MLVFMLICISLYNKNVPNKSTGSYYQLWYHTGHNSESPTASGEGNAGLVLRNSAANSFFFFKSNTGPGTEPKTVPKFPVLKRQTPRARPQASQRGREQLRRTRPCTRHFYLCRLI